MDLGGEHTEVGGRLLQWSRATEWVTREWRQVLVLAVAAASYELGVVTDGSGFIAAWVVSWAGMAVAASAVLVAGRRLVRSGHAGVAVHVRRPELIARPPGVSITSASRPTSRGHAPQVTCFRRQECSPAGGYGTSPHGQTTPIRRHRGCCARSGLMRAGQ